jgi:hypothetical protein
MKIKRIAALILILAGVVGCHTETTTTATDQPSAAAAESPGVSDNTVSKAPGWGALSKAGAPASIPYAAPPGSSSATLPPAIPVDKCPPPAALDQGTGWARKIPAFRNCP